MTEKDRVPLAHATSKADGWIQEMPNWLNNLIWKAIRKTENEGYAIPIKDYNVDVVRRVGFNTFNLAEQHFTERILTLEKNIETLQHFVKEDDEQISKLKADNYTLKKDIEPLREIIAIADNKIKDLKADRQRIEKEFEDFKKKVSVKFRFTDEDFK